MRILCLDDAVSSGSGRRGWEARQAPDALSAFPPLFNSLSHRCEPPIEMGFEMDQSYRGRTCSSTADIAPVVRCLHDVDREEAAES